jgi:hypothetical protein
MKSINHSSESTTEKGTFIQMLHPSNRKSLILDDNIEITRDEFIQKFASGLGKFKEYTVVYALDGSITIRWREGIPVVTNRYTPKK